ncbi:MAG: putative oxidoreductase [Marmoricola sp.]|nr:putative oxidoreductase [Marmoricola sp.]
MANMRVGLVGTRHWSDTVHAPGIAGHPDVELVGVLGRDPGRTAAFAAKHRTTPYTDADALFAEVDALAFAVPPDVQAPLAIKAARAGKHLLLEKPPALDLASADELVDAVEAAGVSAIVFFTQRFVDVWETWLDEVVVAAPAGGRADWMSSQLPGSPYAGSAWRRQQGALWDVGPHMINQLVTALGPIVDVVGTRGEGDLAHLVFTHQGGQTSRMSLTFALKPAAVRVGIEFYGDNGWMIQPALERDAVVAYGRALGELLDMIRTGETRHRCDVRVARDVVAVIERCELVLGPR